MRRALRLFVVAGAIALAGCTALDPYPTAPAPAQPGATAGQRVAICYNRLKTTRAEVQSQAQKECAAGTFAKPADTDWHLDFCPLLLPARATYVCAAKK